MTSIELGAELKLERKRRGLTQKEAGLLLHCSHALVGSAERVKAKDGYTEAGFARLQNGLLSRLRRITTDRQAELLKDSKQPRPAKNKIRNEEIQRLADEGVTLAKIGKQFSVSKQRVDQIIAAFAHKERVCLYCAKPFTPTRRNHRYCAHLCAVAHYAGHTPPHLRNQKRVAEITERIAAPNTRGCWIWRGSFNPTTGYGVVSWLGKSITTHRWMWSQVMGKIQDGMCVLHHCDVPLCVNPKHLFLGTQGENVKDRDAKGRHKKPWRFGSQEISTIRTFYKSPADCRWLAEAYSVHPNSIYKIAMGNSYGKAAVVKRE